MSVTWQNDYQRWMNQFNESYGPPSKPQAHVAPSTLQQQQHHVTEIRTCQCGTKLKVKVGILSHCPRCMSIVGQGASTQVPQQHNMSQPQNMYPYGAMNPNMGPMVCDFCWKTGGKHSKNCPRKPEDPLLKEMRLEREELAMDEEFGAAYVDTDANTFTDYVPSRLQKRSGFKEHPDPVTETSTLGSIAPPELKYKLRLPKQTILEGRLTSLQIESVLYACSQHETSLPQQNVKAGFFMGDGPGVGKGRQIAGIVLENHVRGRTKAVWISVSADLMDDAKRDLKDIGAGAIPVHDLKHYPITAKLSEIKKMQSGVLFSTYALLVKEQKSKKGERKTRLEQILEWCGEDFEGVIAFDEAHKAKNIRVGSKPQQNMHDDDERAKESERSKESDVKGTKAAVAVIDLQTSLPLARIVYVSATGASEPEHLLYATRLGLWGPGTPFADSKQFAKDIKDGGTGAMELLCMQMKQNGQYVARSLSFKGAHFEVVEESLDPKFETTYNQAVELWADLWEAVQLGLKKVDKKDKKKIVSLFWSADQNFWIQMCMAAKVKGVVRIAQQALDDGKCVVIGLQSTGEAGAVEDDSGCSTANSILKNFVEKWAPIDEDLKEAMIERSAKINLPINPLDALIDALGGPKRVAEMTGRQIRQICRRGEWHFVQRGKSSGSSDAINIQERKKFQAGKKLVAIISEAASTGISLQADRRVKNDRRRVHITLQLPWSADKAVQQMGRSHRSNQSSAPEFILLMSPIGGEWRFASQVAERLKTLGAITQGDRRATGRSGIQRFSIEPKYANQALETLIDSITKEKPTAELPEFIQDQYEGKFSRFCQRAYTAMERAGMIRLGGETKLSTKTFMNRLLGIAIEMQGQIFGFWHQLMEGLIRDEKLAGKYQEGIVDIATELNTVKEETVLYTNPDNGAETKYIKISGDRGIAWERAMELYEGQTEELAGFYKKKNEGNRNAKYNALLCLQKREQMATKRTRYFNVVRPNTGFRPEEISRSSLMREYEKIDPEDMEEDWKEIHRYSEHNCGHKSRRYSQTCKGADCTFMKRTTIHNILIGNVLPHWHILKRHCGKKEKVKVVRVSATCGRRFVGAIVSGEHIEAVKRDIMKLESLSDEKMALQDINTTVIPDEKAPVERKKNEIRVVDLSEDKEEEVEEEVLLEGGGDDADQAKAGEKAAEGDDETEDEDEVEGEDGPEKAEDKDKDEIASTTRKRRKKGKKKKDLLVKQAEPVEISDDDMDLDPIVEVEARTEVEKDSAGKDADLVECGLWEEDENADALFADGLRICEEANQGRYNGQKEEGDETEEDEACGSETESEGEEDATTPSSSRAAKRSVRGKGSAKSAPRARKPRQSASSLLMEKAMKIDEEAKKIRVDGNAKQEFKDNCKKFMAGLLGRQELSGTFAESAVRQAIRAWIPERSPGIGDLMRSAATPRKELAAPKETLKREIKELHPSCVNRTLNSLSNKGIKRVLALMGFFAQGYVRQVFGKAVVRGIKTINRRWLVSEQGQSAIRDVALRHVLGLRPLPEEEVVVQVRKPPTAPVVIRSTQRALESEDEAAGEADETQPDAVDAPAQKAATTDTPSETSGEKEKGTPTPALTNTEAPSVDDVSDAGTESETDLDDDEVRDDSEDPMDQETEESDVESSPSPSGATRAKPSAPPAVKPSVCCKEGCKHGRSWGVDFFYIQCIGCEVWFHGECVGVKDGAIPDDVNWACCQDCADDVPLSKRSEAIIVGKPKKKASAGSKHAGPRMKPDKASKKAGRKAPDSGNNKKAAVEVTLEEASPGLQRKKKPNKDQTTYCKKSCLHGRSWDGEAEMIMCEACEVWFHADCAKVDIAAIPEQAPWVCCHSCKYELPLSNRRKAVVGSALPTKDSGGRVIDWKADKVGAAKNKPPASAATESAAPAQATPAAAEDDDDDSDDDVPILALQPKGGRSTSATASDCPLLRLLPPLAAFTGRERMTKKDAMAEVLNHVKQRNLFDHTDWDYVLPDEKLQVLVGKKSRIKLRKLARKVAQLLVDDATGEAEPDAAADDEDSPKSTKKSAKTPTSIVCAEQEEAAATSRDPVKRLGFAVESDSEDEAPLIAGPSSAESPTTPVVSATAEVVDASWYADEGVAAAAVEARPVDAAGLGEASVAAAVQAQPIVAQAEPIVEAPAPESETARISTARDRLDEAPPPEQPPRKRTRYIVDSDDSDDDADSASKETNVPSATTDLAEPAQSDNSSSDTPSVAVPSEERAEDVQKQQALQSGTDHPPVEASGADHKRKRDPEGKDNDSEDGGEPFASKAPKTDAGQDVAQGHSHPEPPKPSLVSTTLPVSGRDFIPDSDDEFDGLDVGELDAAEAAALKEKESGLPTSTHAPAAQVDVVYDSDEEFEGLCAEELLKAEQAALASRDKA